MISFRKQSIGFKVPLGLHLLESKFSMYCGSSMSKLTSGQPASCRYVSRFYWLTCQIQEQLAGFLFPFPFLVLHCIFNLNVNWFVSINVLLQSSPSLFIFIVLYILNSIHQIGSVYH